MLCNVRSSPLTEEVARWVSDLLARGHSVLVPEITDYEVRRELLRGGRLASVRRLDALAGELGYIPLKTECMRDAAELWATARRAGRPTADRFALDGDAILAAQALYAA